MAVAGVKISWNSPDLDRLRKDLIALADPRANAEVLKDALRKAIKPPLERLKQITPIGPTGNLRRAVSSKVKAYPNDGGAVGLVGYERAGKSKSASAQGGTVRAGKDRAFHQWWLEFGTKQRLVTKFSNKPYQRSSPKADFTRVRLGNRETVRGRGLVHWVSGQNSYIASSFNRLGPFKMVTTPDGRVETDPAYPKAFFKKSETPIVIQPTPAGGVAGVPPVRSAFESTQPQVAEILTRELRISLQRAWDALTVRDTGSITGV
jgi:hypothetical protein